MSATFANFRTDTFDHFSVFVSKFSINFERVELAIFLPIFARTLFIIFVSKLSINFERVGLLKTGSFEKIKSLEWPLGVKGLSSNQT